MLTPTSSPYSQCSRQYSGPPKSQSIENPLLTSKYGTNSKYGIYGTNFLTHVNIIMCVNYV